MDDQILIGMGKAIFIVLVYILSTGLFGGLTTMGSDEFAEDVPWAMYVGGCALYLVTVLILWD